MSRLLIKNGRVLDPASGLDAPGDVLVEAGAIAAVGAGLDGRGAEILDAEGGWIAPGFVDLHCHLREPGQEYKEDIASGGRAAVAGGFTSVACMANTQPVNDDPSVTDYILDRARTDSPARVHPVAAATKGQKGEVMTEMVALVRAGAVAFSDDGKTIMDSGVMRRVLEYSKLAGRPVMTHAEDRTLVGEGVVNEGPVSTRLGLPGNPAVAEVVHVARDIMLAEVTGAHLHVAHVSTAGAVQLIREARERGVHVTAEVTPHHLLLTDAWVAGERTGPLADALAGMGLPLGPGERYDTATKVNPPLRAATDADALLVGLLDGTLDAIATDHAPHTLVDKACEYGEAAFGISGLETALGALLALVHARRLPLPTLVAALTARPARAFGLPGGTLAVGAPADVVVFDPDEEWTVDPARFASKGQNTPLAGARLRGRVRLTLLGGATVYDAAGSG